MLTNDMILNPIVLRERLAAAERVCRSVTPILAAIGISQATDGDEPGVVHAWDLRELRDALAGWRGLTDGA